jgi:hypothetical protein
MAHKTRHPVYRNVREEILSNVAAVEVDTRHRCHHTITYSVAVLQYAGPVQSPWISRRSKFDTDRRSSSPELVPAYSPAALSRAPFCPPTDQLLEGFRGMVLPGDFLNRLAMWSIGAVSSPMMVSNGGFLPALRWLRNGTNAFVLPKLFAIDSGPERSRTSSSAGRSWISSSLI